MLVELLYVQVLEETLRIVARDGTQEVVAQFGAQGRQTAGDRAGAAPVAAGDEDDASVHERGTLT